MATERELKFSTTDEHVPSAPELQQALDGSGYTIAPGRVGRHVDTYHDAGGKLAAAGVALRLRRNASGGQRVTLKADARLTSPAMGVMHERSELELVLPETPAQAGDGVPWPDAVVAALPAGVVPGDLAPTAELRIRRVTFLIHAAQSTDVERGGNGASTGSQSAMPIAELAFDEVMCVAPGAARVADAAAIFHEVEIEWLAQGDDVDAAKVALGLERVAKAVGTVVKLTPSPVAKLERALALLAAMESD